MLQMQKDKTLFVLNGINVPLATAIKCSYVNVLLCPLVKTDGWNFPICPFNENIMKLCMAMELL